MKPPTRRRLVSVSAAAAVAAASLAAAGGVAVAEVRKPAVHEPAVQKPAVHGPAVQKPAVQKPAVQKPAANVGTAHGRTVDSIALPGGFAPEGITDDGRRTVFVGSLGPQRGSAANGAIYAADVRTGRGRVLVPGAEGQSTVGITYHRGLIWAAGGRSGVVRVHDARSGRLVRSWAVPGSVMLNDVVATDRAVYVTDSATPQLTVIPLGERGRLPAEPTVLPVTGVQYQAEGANLNGIVAYGRTLVTVQSNTGKLFRLDPRTAAATEIPVDGGPLLNGDGLEQANGKLYVNRNRDNLIAEVKLNRRLTAAVVTGTFTDPQFDIPSTSTYVAGYLWAVNARFTTNPVTPKTTFTVERVDIRR